MVRIRDAITQLAGSDSFDVFMGAVRDQMDVALRDSLNDEVAKSDRLSLLAKGECRTYLAIIDLYEDAMTARAERQAKADEEQIAAINDPDS